MAGPRTQGAAMAQDTVKIGYIDPLSGGGASVGEVGLKTFQFLADEIDFLLLGLGLQALEMLADARKLGRRCGVGRSTGGQLLGCRQPRGSCWKRRLLQQLLESRWKRATLGHGGRIYVRVEKCR